MSTQSEVDTVLAWHEALNAGDVEGFLSVSDPDIELVGPRGSAFGRAVLREWQAKAGLTLQPREVYAAAGVVVVTQRAMWTQAGEVTGEADVATVFRVHNGAVSYVNRLDSLDTALELAGLTTHDRKTS